MAYTRTQEPNCPIPADPGVVHQYVPVTTGETNMPIRVPWNGCKLAYAYTTYVGTEAGAAPAQAIEIDLELDAAGGTEMMSITIASASAVGAVDEGTISSVAACSGLTNQNTVMIEMDADGDESVFGGVNVYLYFEPGE